MALEIRTLMVEDFRTVLEQDSRAAANDPIFRTKCQVLNSREVHQYRRAHCRQIFENETVETLKVVDQGARETILAYLQMRFVSIGDPDLMSDPPCSEQIKNSALPMDAFYASLCGKAMDGILSLRDEVLRDEQYYHLIELAMVSSTNGVEAWSMLLRYATEQADRGRLLLYIELESTDPRVPLLRNCGFEVKGERQIDLTRYGGEGEFKKIGMVKEPKQAVKEE